VMQSLSPVSLVPTIYNNCFTTTFPTQPGPASNKNDKTSQISK